MIKKNGFLGFVLLGLMASPAIARISSPGNVTFSNPTSLNSTATFDSSGTFVLQLSAFDGIKTTTATTTVTVLPAIVTLAPNLSVGNASGAIAGNSWGVFVFLSTGTTAVSSVQFDMTLPVGISTPTVAAGTASTAAGKTAAGNLLAGNIYRVILSGLNTTAIGSGLLATVNVRIDPSLLTGTYALAIGGLVGSDSAGISVPLTGTNGSLSVTANAAPTVSAGTNQSITLPASALLSATASDDGAPNPPGVLVYTWSVL